MNNIKYFNYIKLSKLAGQKKNFNINSLAVYSTEPLTQEQLLPIISGVHSIEKLL